MREASSRFHDIRVKGIEREKERERERERERDRGESRALAEDVYIPPLLSIAPRWRFDSVRPLIPSPRGARFQTSRSIPEFVVSRVTYATCQAHRARITYEVVSQDIRRDSANRHTHARARAHAEARPAAALARISTYRRYLYAAYAVKHICTWS
jgi:hypothetical protein